MIKTLQALVPSEEFRISELLLARLGSVEPKRPIANLHASSLTSQTKFCPREVVLCKKLGRKPYPGKIDPATTITFDEGKDKQYRLNNDWLRDRMVGNWRCDGCGVLKTFCKAPKPTEGQCKECQWVYQEVCFSHPTGARGSIDGLIDIHKPTLRMIEAKIISPDVWEKLKAPVAEHRIRSRLYMKLIAESNHPYRGQVNTSKVHILYFMRGHGKKDEKGRVHPLKEFILERDDASVKPYFDMAQAVQTAKEAEWEIFPEGICSSLFDKRCHMCSVSKECFAGKFPATIKWKTE
jgi:hypothetical protein